MGQARRKKLAGSIAPKPAPPTPAPNIVKDGHGIEHDIAKARMGCKWCLGTGIQATAVKGEKRECTICRCVTEFEAEQKKQSESVTP